MLQHLTALTALTAFMESSAITIYTSSCVLPYVYLLTHKETKQFYFGYRYKNSIPSDQDLPQYRTSSTKVQKLGFENFNYIILAEFYSDIDAYDFEQRLIEEHFSDPLNLNGTYTKAGSKRYRHTGFISEETKAKISQSKLGKPLSDAHRLACSEGSKGKKMSLEARAKMSASRTGLTRSDETKAKMTKSKLGKVHTQESKDRMSAAQKGKKLTEEHKANISKVQKGKIFSQEYKDKLSKTYRIITESGNIIEGIGITNWCREHSICTTRLFVESKRDNFYKGYKRLF